MSIFLKASQYLFAWMCSNLFCNFPLLMDILFFPSFFYIISSTVINILRRQYIWYLRGMTLVPDNLDSNIGAAYCMTLDKLFSFSMPFSEKIKIIMVSIL